MSRKRILVSLSIVILGVLAAAPSLAWEENGEPICTESGDQQGLQIVADGEGGFYIVWQDMRNGTWDIYAQRRNLRGELVWGEEDLAISVRDYDQTDPRAVTDGAGGFWVVWTDQRTSRDIYGQHVFADGTFLWQENGAQICSAQADQFDARIVANGFGGAIVVWTDTRSLDGDIYAQHIDASGALVWQTYGILVCNHGLHQEHPDLTLLSGTDWDDTRVTVVWEDSRNGNVDLYAQRLTLDGVVQWGGVGLPVSTDEYYDEKNFSVVAGLSGSSIISWENSYGYTYYYEHLGMDHFDRYGVSSGWNFAPYGHTPRLEPDGFGGVLIGYSDHSFGDNESNPYLKRYNPDGSQAYITGLGYNYYWEMLDTGTRIAGDGNGGGIACFLMNNYSSYTLRTKRISHDGDSNVWGSYVNVCTRPGYHWGPEIIMLDEGSALVAWCDERDSANTGTNIYAQRLAYRDGAWGYMPPHISEVADLPGDSGGAVVIHLEASDKDITNPVADPITGYNVWRQIDQGAAGISDYARVLEQMGDSTKAAGQQIDARMAERLGFPEGNWISLGFHAATQQRQYDLFVPTMNDSSAAGIPWETYVVTAHTPVPSVYYISNLASGYSVDNLDPGYYSDSPLPAGVSLSQNRPNPFNPNTTIAFGVEKDGSVDLLIFDVTGRLVCRLLDGEIFSAGHHEIIWNGRDDGGRMVASGTYYYRLETDGFREAKRMVLIK